MLGMPMSLQYHCCFPSHPQSRAFCSEHLQSLLILSLWFTPRLCLQVPCKEHSFRAWFACHSALLKNYWPARVMLLCLPRIFSGSVRDQKPWYHCSSWHYKLRLKESLCCLSGAWSQFKLTVPGRSFQPACSCDSSYSDMSFWVSLWAYRQWVT